VQETQFLHFATKYLAEVILRKVPLDLHMKEEEEQELSVPVHEILCYGQAYQAGAQTALLGTFQCQRPKLMGGTPSLLYHVLYGLLGFYTNSYGAHRKTFFGTG
jgi:hypothetical protein